MNQKSPYVHILTNTTLSTIDLFLMQIEMSLALDLFCTPCGTLDWVILIMHHLTILNIIFLYLFNQSWVSPHFSLFKKILDYKFLKAFGCACYPRLRPYHPHKFAYHTREGPFLGYFSNHTGYKCLISLIPQ